MKFIAQKGIAIKVENSKADTFFFGWGGIRPTDKKVGN
jgi:hypothetical protein